MEREVTNSERLGGLLYLLVMAMYVVYVIYALLPEWKREQAKRWIRNRLSPPKTIGDWATEREIIHFRKLISRWEHEQGTRDN